MKLNKIQREKLKQKYDGQCAYCGDELSDKWHADHLDAWAVANCLVRAKA